MIRSPCTKVLPGPRAHSRATPRGACRQIPRHSIESGRLKLCRIAGEIASKGGLIDSMSRHATLSTYLDHDQRVFIDSITTDKLFKTDGILAKDSPGRLWTCSCYALLHFAR